MRTIINFTADRRVGTAIRPGGGGIGGALRPCEGDAFGLAATNADG